MYEAEEKIGTALQGLPEKTRLLSIPVHCSGSDGGCQDRKSCSLRADSGLNWSEMGNTARFKIYIDICSALMLPCYTSINQPKFCFYRCRLLCYKGGILFLKNTSNMLYTAFYALLLACFIQ